MDDVWRNQDRDCLQFYAIDAATAQLFLVPICHRYIAAAYPPPVAAGPCTFSFFRSTNDVVAYMSRYRGSFMMRSTFVATSLQDNVRLLVVQVR